MSGEMLCAVIVCSGFALLLGGCGVLLIALAVEIVRDGW